MTDLLAETVATRPTEGALSFREVNDEEDWRRVREFRVEQYGRLLPYMLAELDASGSDDLDGRSCVFAAFWEGRVVGTIRLTPYPFETLRYIPAERLDAFLGEGWRSDYLEWSRLLVDHESPVRRVMPALLTYAGLRTLTATPYRRYFGYATTNVQKVFRRFNVDVDSEPFTIASRSSNSYVMLKGDFMRDFLSLVHTWKTLAQLAAPSLGAARASGP